MDGEVEHPDLFEGVVTGDDSDEDMVLANSTMDASVDSIPSPTCSGSPLLEYRSL